MKKLCCMIALAAVSFGSVYAVVPLHSTSTVQTDTGKMKKKMKKMKMKKDSTMKKDTTKM